MFSIKILIFTTNRSMGNPLYQVINIFASVNENGKDFFVEKLAVMNIFRKLKYYIKRIALKHTK